MELEPWGPIMPAGWKTFINVSPFGDYKIIKVKISNQFWHWKFVWGATKEIWIQHPDMVGFSFVGTLENNELIGDQTELYNITKIMIEKFKDKKLSYILV